MKKIFSILAIASAILAFNSCEQQSVEEFKSIDHLTFTSAKPEIQDAADTKTGWTGSSVQWLAGDKIRVGFTLDGAWHSSGKADDTTPRFYASSALDADTDIASFAVPFDGSTFQESVKTLEGDIVFYGVYPSDACSSAGQKNAPDIYVTIPNEQKPSASSFDSSADLMVGQSKHVEAMTEDPILMSWNRVVALADITLKGLNVPEGEKLLNLILTAQESANLAGSQIVNVTDGTYTANESTNEIKLNVSSLEINSNNLEVWAVLLPETVSSLKVVLETDSATYTKEISGLSLSFKKNKRNILGIKMGDAVRESKEVNKYALLETSNVELVKGENGYDDLTVDNEFAIKVGTGKLGGSMSVTVPAGSTKLHLHAAAWKDVTGLSLNISGATTNPTSIALTSDSGITGNGPFELSGSVDDYYFAIDLSGIDTQTDITFTSSIAKRFVVWGVNVEPEPKEITWNITGIEVTTAPNKTSYTVGQTFNPTGMVVTATYVDADDASNTKTAVISNDELTYSPSLETALAFSDDKVTVSYQGVSAIIAITVAEAPETTPDPEIIVFSEGGYTNGEVVTTASAKYFSVTFDKGTNTNDPKYYTTGSAVRAYGGNTFTVSSANFSIDKIEITFASGEGTNVITSDSGEYSDGVWTGSSNSVKFTIGGTSGHRRIASIKVTYE